MAEQYRIEQDALGEVRVPAHAYWGAQTERSRHNFPFPTHEKMPLEIIYGLVEIKRAAALIHQKSGALPGDIADAIVSAADSVLSGAFDTQFPLAIWQTGSGTQSNMNVNEVLASIANEKLTRKRGGNSPVHPNDHVNKGQSSNDSFPTAIHIAIARMTSEKLLPALCGLMDTLEAKAKYFEDIIKIGRTHLQDATPLLLSQEFGGYVAQLMANKNRIQGALEHNVCKLAQGGTAVGTGLNAPENFDRDMAAALADRFGLHFEPARSKFEALASSDGLVFFSGALNTLAVSLMKIANDIRLLGSGPRAGLGELILPENEPGSSIMPGKVNPTQCEMLTMVSAQIIGNHQAITIGGMQGQMELNVFRPLIGANLVRSVALAATGMESFTKNCIAGLEANRERINELLNRSLMLVTALVPLIGYDRASAIAHKAHHEGTGLREAALASGVSAADYDATVKPENMV